MILALLTALALAQDVPTPPEAPTGPDRSAAPEVLPPQALPVRDPEVHTLGEGVTVWFVPLQGVRKIEIDVVLLKGTLDLDGAHTEAARATGWLQDVATERFDAETLSTEQDLRQAHVSSDITQHWGQISLDVPREDLDAGLELLDQVLKHPTFPKNDVKLYQRDRLQHLELTGPRDPDAVAWSTLAHAWFAADHPYGRRPNPDEIRKIKPAHLTERHARWLAMSPVTIVAVGDTTWEALEPKLTALAAGLGAPGSFVNEIPVPPLAAHRVVAVDLPGHEQTLIRMRANGPFHRTEEHPVAMAVNFALGGHFLSRLNTNLREDKGWTYGSRSSYNAWDQRAAWTLSVDVKKENTAGAITEIRKELDKLATEGATTAELSAARNGMVGSWNEIGQTAGSALRFYDGLLLSKDDAADVIGWYETIGTLDVATTQQVARTYLGPEAPRLWVLVGDRATIEAQTNAFDWTIEWITPEQAILGTF